METKSSFTGLMVRGLALLAGTSGTGALAQFTEAATPVAAGAWRMDADLYARAEDWDLPGGWGGRGRSDAWAWTQVGVGLNSQLEARVSWQAYRRDKLDGAVTEGAGDVYLAAKWHIAGDEATGAAWSAMPYVKLPTAGARFADDTVDAGALLIFGRPLGETGYVNAQLGWDDYGDGAGGRDHGLSGSAVAGRYLGERWTVYGETITGLYPLNGDSDAFAASAGGGVTWSGDADGSWGVDLAAYGAVTRSAPDLLAVLRVWFEWGGAPAASASVSAEAN